MIQLKDLDGTVLSYWPVTALKAGTTSQVLTFTITFPSPAPNGAALRATPDSRMKTWAKRTSDGSYTDISLNPYSVAGLSGTVEFEVYVEALSPISGFQRIADSVSVATGSGAGWEI